MGPGLRLALLDGYKCMLHLVEGKYSWMEGNPTWFPAFQTYLEKMISMKIMRRKLIKPLGYF